MLENIVKLITDYLSENWKEIAIKLLIAVTVFFVILFFIKRLTKKIKARIEKNSVQTDEKYTKKISHLIWNMIFTLLMIFNVLIVFEIIWFDVALLMWWVSLWMWFAMETTIGNMVSWIMILLNKKVKLWDYVQMLWSLKLTWVIDEINIRYTIIKTIDKRRVIVPNMKLATTPIKTLKTEPLIRWEIDLTLPRNINVEQIKKVLTDTINSEEKVVHKDYTNVFISWFDFHGINFKWFFFYDPKWWKWKFVICSELRQKLKIIFKKLWINPPYENITITTE